MAIPSTLPPMRLELVPIPVSDVNRAKAFYEQATRAALAERAASH